MNNLLKTVGGVVVLAFFAGGSAFAAAGDAQKWNIGISAGYAMTNKPSVALNRQEIIDKQIKNYPVTNSKFSKSLNGVAANINIGYSMNDNVRFGLGVGYRQLKFNKAKGFEQMKYDKDIGMSTKVLTGGATVYYDFINNSLLTPFVSLGFGMQHVTGKFDLPLYGDEDKYEGEIGTPGKTGQAKITSHDGKLKRKNDFRAELGVGVGLKVVDGVHLELAYKLANSTPLKYDMSLTYGQVTQGSTPTTPATYEIEEQDSGSFKINPTLEHSISLGVRFNF